MKIGLPKRKRSYSNHPISGAFAVSFREVVGKQTLGAAPFYFSSIHPKHTKHGSHLSWNERIMDLNGKKIKARRGSSRRLVLASKIDHLEVSLSFELLKSLIDIIDIMFTQKVPSRTEKSWVVPWGLSMQPQIMFLFYELLSFLTPPCWWFKHPANHLFLPLSTTGL